MPTMTAQRSPAPRKGRPPVLDNYVQVLRVYVCIRLRRKGISVAELARHFDVTPQTVYNWLELAPDVEALLADDALPSADPTAGLEILRGTD